MVHLLSIVAVFDRSALADKAQGSSHFGTGQFTSDNGGLSEVKTVDQQNKGLSIYVHVALKKSLNTLYWNENILAPEKTDGPCADRRRSSGGCPSRTAPAEQQF
jgi:hypothetical protein